MRKNRSTWAVLLSVVLALVVMASLAVTSFAETEGRVPTDAELSAVLSGSASPTAGINFDVDGNGIVEWDDLACLRGEQKDPMPNGEEDIFSLLNENNKTDAHLQSAIVLGDSSKAAGLNGKLGTTATLVFKEAVDFTGYANLKFDIFWRSTNGALKVTLTSGGKDYEIPVTPAKAGWSAAVAEIPEDARAAVTKITFTLTGGEEGSVAYIDNIRTGDKAITTNVVFNSNGGSAVATKTYNVGATYGELPVPVKTFYTFEGWYLNGEKVTADTVVAVEAEHTLLAKWALVQGEDGTITVADEGSNTFGITMDGSYKQIRFQFKVHSGALGLNYNDGDGNIENDPLLVIVDAEGNAVRQSDVEVGKWYTAILYGGSFTNSNTVIVDGAGLAKSATLSFDGNAVEVKHLETLIGQYGTRVLGNSDKTLWTMVDLSAYGYVNGYVRHMRDNTIDNNRIVWTVLPGRYTKLTFDLYITNEAIQKGESAGMSAWTARAGGAAMPIISITNLDTNKTVGKTEMVVGTWYRFEIDLNGISGGQYLYLYGSDEAAAANKCDVYLANVNFIGDGSMADNLDPAISVTADKAGTAGSFVTSPVTRDTDRGTFYVKNDSANWSDRVIRVTRNDTTKEMIQVDFRFVTSKDASGKDIAPTLKVSTTLTGTLKQAQYVILDQNDTPVTALETGKWYRMFIYANGSNTFGLVPATTGEVELQLEGLETFNADELPVTMISGNPALGSVSAVLTRFGKMQYAYAGTAANAMTLTLDKNTYKQVRFSFQMQEKVAAIGISGANLTIKDADGKVVTASGLKVGTWYTAVVLNNSNALPKNLLMQISGGTAMTIKDLVAYETVADPADKTASDIFRGLDDDEMMLSGFIGPREEVYVGYYAYDQKSNPKASLARDEIFKLLAEAGLNYISDSGVDYNGASTENTGHILRLAAKYGITYYPSVSSIASIGADTGEKEEVKFLHENGYTNSTRDRKIYTETFVSSDVAASAKLLLELYQYESFGGLYLRDEPASDLFDEVASAVAHINAAKEYANKEYGVQMLLNNYVNMLCFYNRSGSLDNFTYYKNPVTGATATRGLSWQQYLTYSVEHIGMNYISFDIYPVTTSGIDSGFLNYLGAVANVSKETNGTPWMGYAQVGGGVPAYDSEKKEVTQSELYWDVNTMLAFGAKGILYYIGVTPQYYVGPNNAIQQDHSLIDNEGNTTQYYEVVKGINEQIQAMDHVLMKSTFNGVITNGRGACSYTSGGSDAGTSFGDWSLNNKLGNAKLGSVGGTASLIGVFDYNGKTALLVMNNTVNATDSNDAGKEGTINLTFNSGNYTYEIIQDATTSWATGTNLDLSLLPGRCALVVVHENAAEQEINVEFFLNYNTDEPGPTAITISMVNGQYVYPELPTPANRMFYTFAGWFADAECTIPVVAGQAVVSTADHGLYAKWDAAQVEIAFNTGNYLTAESIDGIVLNVNDTYGELPTPVRPYHTFGGWYLDAACTGDAVTADTKVTISHTLYAKWIEDEDSSLLKFTSGNATTVSVYRDGIGAKDTVVYTTEGMQLDGNGYGRPVKMVLSDTSKEVIKFRFQFASCDANLEKLTMNYTVGKNTDINNGNYGNYVVLDANGNATYEMEVGKWYTFYGVTLGYENLYLWPVTNTTEEINVTMYFQDREALDYEPEVNIHQENTAYYGNAAPYQDAQGNWLVHYRSFTGSGAEGVFQHNNTAWDRRTYINIPANYTHASFEFRFNVSQYAAAGAELADKIVAFEYMRAYYTDLDGNPVAVEDMEVGTWYRATFGNPIPESNNYTIAMGTVQPGNGAIVNIDMDYRNVQCYTHETDYSFTRYYYTNIYYGAAGGQLAHMLRTPYHTDGTNAIDRRVLLNVANNSGDLISMKVYFTECSGTPALAIANGGSGAVSYTIMDANGNAADGNNLQLNQWYTVSWIGDGSASYQLRPFVGTAVNGTFFVRDVKVQQVENPFRAPTGGEMYVTNAAPAGSSGYYSSVTPVVIGDEVAYKHYIWATGDGTNGRERRAHLVVTAAEKQIVSMKVYFDSCSTGATPSIQILRGDAAALCYLVTDADGNVVDGNNLQTGKWYTVSWIAESGQTNYRIYPITGTKGYGTYYMKDISVKSVEGPLSSTYYAWVMPYAEGQYLTYVRPTGDGTNISHRQINLAINSAARDTISLDMKVTATTGTQLLKIVNAAGAEMAITIVGKDDGIAVDSTAMELDKWYTVSWTSDGSASYGIRTFDGSAVNGKYFVKNIQNTAYVPAVYDVSFNLGYEGATAPETIQVTEGNAYGVLPVPARQDYIFGGWYLEVECINAVTAESIVNSTHTLYAKWIKASVTVSFNYGDAEAREVNVGEAYGELPVVADRLGYIFGGWYLDAECTAEVTADTIVTKTESHTLYAKWTAKADTNEELTVVVGNATTTDVLFDTVGGKETAIYTTEGKQLDGNGYGRPVKMVLADTSKEVIKFRFQFASCDADLEKLTFNYLVGVNADVNSGNYGNYVVLDEEGNATYEFEVGKWYTFYGLTLGKENLYWWPVTNTTEQINVTMYFQDREALDYEPDVNIRQENTAFYGNAAPYQDAEGNWLVHYRSFTGDGAEGALQHNNTAWNRRTYIDIPAEYNYASFEFRFNVSQYAAADAELVTNIEGFGYLNATYVDMNGTPVKTTDMVEGQWYKAIFANPIPESGNYTIIMGFKNGGSGAVVNIDMDFRNAQGYTIGEVTDPFTYRSDIGTYYGAVTPVILGDEVIYKHTLKYTNDGTNDSYRRVHLNVSGSDKKIISMKVYFESVEHGGTPSIRVFRSDDGVSGFIVTDENGNVVDRMNLELKQWYTVSWFAEGGVPYYQIRPYTGTAASGTYYMKDITMSDFITSDVLTGNYYTWVLPVEQSGSYMVHARYTGDGTNISHREAILAIPNSARDTISMDIYVAATSGTQMLKVLGASELATTITDAEGNTVDSTEMELGKWYTLSWTSDGSATYKIRTFDGSAANGTYYLKNIRNNAYVPEVYDVSFNLGYEGATAPETIQVTEGNAYGELPVPVRQNYIFGGWYLEAECINAVTAESIVNSTHTLYAKWIEATITISFNYGDAEARTVKVGEAYGELPVVADRLGYIFGGWYLDAECTAEVTADTIVTKTENHTLYAKWTAKADTNEALKVVVGNETTTAVLFDMVDGKETAIYTTEGKQLDNHGYGRPVKMVLSDTSKEVIKFRFQFASCDATVEKLTFNYTVGVLADANSGNYGNYVVLDENGNATYEFEVGKWYTFYGLTLGKENLYWWPVTNTEEQINATMYFQDREALDYEPEVNIRQENTAYYGNAAPYQDAQGNWLVHYRSFTGSGAEGALQHGNSGWNRRTYIDIPEGYDYASFEFRFNVSQYAAAGEELADRIEKFYGLNATYFDMNGTPVAVSEMVVGQWYRAVFAPVSYFIAMSDVNGGSGATVNIDMDYRNAYGFNSAEITNPYTPVEPYYGKVTPVKLGDEVIYKHHLNGTNDATNATLRGLNLSQTGADKKIMSVKVFFESVSDMATPAISVYRSDRGVLGYVVTDAQGNVVDPMNLELKQWYTVTWLANGGINTYQIRPYTGGHKTTESGEPAGASGDYYVTNVTVRDYVESSLLTGNYYTWVLPMEATGSYMVHVRYTGDGATFDAHRFVELHITNSARDTISADIMIGAYGTSSLLKVKNASGAELPFTITDSEGNTVESTEMVKGKWYTLSWTADGSATYKIHSFDGDNTGGKLAGNGTYYLKNIQNQDYVPEVYDVSFDLGYEGEAPATIQVVEGNAYGELPVPARQDYIFGGWYLEAECINAVTAESIVNSTHTLYAKWIKASVMVSFNYGDAEAREVNVGEAYGELPVVADRLGYIFSGWYLDAECTAEVTAETIVTKAEDHTLYAKWTAKADTNEALKVVVGNENTTAVLFDMVEGKETAIYTTEGKLLDGNGYGRPVKMVLSDTSKEVIKFRFQFASCDADLEKLTFNYLVGVNADVNSGNYGNYVVLDENGNVTFEFEVGKWYTFYGLTLGKENLYWWTVTNSTEEINVTMYFQDREVLDYEPEVNIHQENTAYYGNAAPYQDAQGNWLVHFHSFTGSGAEGVFQHTNNAWNRRTYIDIPEGYDYASFEFRFNVSQYAAAGAELATHIEGFGYLNAIYFDMSGTPVAVSDMVVGQWYRAVFANPIPESGNYTIAMGFKNGGDGAIVNIDMDYRNAYGFNSAEVTNPFTYTSTGDYYGAVMPVVLGDEVVYKRTLKYTNDPTNDNDRRLDLNMSGSDKQIMSMKVYFETVEHGGVPSIRVFRSDAGVLGYVVTDAQGNVVDPMNLELKQWYTVTWLANGGIEKYQIRPYTGASASGTYYMKDITMTDYVASDVLVGGYYTWVLDVPGTDTHMVHVRYTGDGTNIDAHRFATLNINSGARDTISADIMIGAYGTNSLLKVKNASGAELSFTIVDSEGNAVESTAMELGKWYKLTWTADGSEKYTIHSFGGEKLAGNGTYYMKNIEVAPYVAAQYDVSFDLGYEGEAPATITVVEGNAYGELPAPTRPGYTFNGWYLSSGEAVTAQTIATATEAHTLYAKWTCNVSFSYPTEVYLASPTGTYYASVAETTVDGEVAYEYSNKTANFHSGVTAYYRRVILNIDDFMGGTVSMKVKFTSVKALDGTALDTTKLVITPINGDDTPIALTVTDENGVTVAADAMAIGQWYTISFTGLGTRSYEIRPFNAGGENGIFLMKDFQVTKAAVVDDFNPTLRFAITSDVHIYNRYQNSWEEKTHLNNLLDVAYGYANASSYTNLDAFLVAGDISEGTAGIENVEDEFVTFKKIVDGAIKEGTQFLVGMGNHDYRKNGSYEDAGAKEMEELFLSTFGLDSTDQHVVINGYHFISLSPTAENLGLRVGESYSAEKLAWLDAELQKAAAEDPNKAIFVMQHHHVTDTVYGSDYSTAAMDAHYAELYNVLAKYPQVVDFSGHSHWPINDPRSIWQGAFTALGTGTLSYAGVNINGLTGSVTPTGLQGDYGSNSQGAESYAMFQIIEMNAAGDMRVFVYDLNSFTEVCRYVISNPVTNKDYTVGQQDVPVFEEGTDAYYEDGYVYFQQATSDDVIESYRAEVYEGETLIGTYYGLSGYIYPNRTPEYLRIKVGELISVNGFTVKIYAVNINNELSAPIELAIEPVIIQSTVDFNLGYAGAESVDSIIVTAGLPYGNLPTPADREYHTFGGWYLDAACTGEAVTADTIVTASVDHTLYAKWTEKEDTTGLKFTTHNANTTDIYRETIGGKETVVYTTEGKQLDGNGYGRPVKMVLSDTSKEVIKFRFQFVSCDATVEKLTFNYTVGVNTDANSGNYGNYVVLDENGKATYEFEVGKWYTFYGRTLGKENLYLWPVTNTTEKINVTMHFQDREVLDYEPDVNIRQEGTAFFGNAAPYQDAEGNWLVHYRSFTGSGAEGALQHNNTAWDRRTYIDIPATYDYASFEFRFNVSQYAAAGAELADKIVAFEYLKATYFDMNGTPISVADMVVGQWYRAVFANPIPTSTNYTIVMGTVQPGSGAIVNIDMDYRNAYGFNSAELSNPFLTPAGGDMYNTNTPAGPSGYYSSVTPIVLGDEVIYKHYIWATGDGTNSQLRRTHLTTTAAEKQVISMKVYFESCSATPSLEIFRSDKGAVVYVVSDANGNVVDPLNLQVGQWYTVSWLADKNITEYRIQPITGSAANGTYYMKDINVQTVEGLLTSEYYGWVMPYAEGQYLVNVRVTGDPTGIGDRKINLNIANTAQDVISMNIKMTETSGTQLLKVKNASGAEMAITICDAEGNIVDSTAMVLGQWYTVSWRADGSAKYTIHAFDGSAVGGKYFLKNIEVAPYVPEVYDVSFDLGYEGEAPATIQVVEGNAYGELPVPTRQNYIFGGWYLEAECINAVNAEMIVTGTHTLYAKWIKASVMVSFNYGDAEAREVNVGEAYGELPTLADRLGYIFGGWYLDAEYTAEVTAETIVTKTEDHTIYAKWTAKADTNEELTVVVGNATTTDVLFDTVGGKETAIYTTEGKQLDGNGYGRPVKMVLSDTSKEVIKFRFQFASCDADLEKLTFNYLVGVNADVNNGNYGNYVVLDENGNVTYEFEVGKWYTFYGVTLGKENLYWWPVTNTTEQINVTMYFQDREVLDYEPEVNIHQENTAYYGNAAPYQDAQGNWLVHYRSFTGSSAEGAFQHANSGWNRRTYIDIPEGYDYASFEFRFNVSQYAAAGAELADRIEKFYGLNATYFDMDGTPVAVSEMVVGQWYRAVFAPVSYFIAMSDVNGGSGATVNIDMDFRNAYGYNSAELSNPYTPIESYYGKVTPVKLGDEVIYKHHLNGTNDATNATLRGLNLSQTGADKKIMSVKVCFESVSDMATPAISVYRSDRGVLGYVVTDAQGNVVDPMNLELKQWYTVTWLANGGINTYQIRPYSGGHVTKSDTTETYGASGDYYVTNVTVCDYVESSLLTGNYYTWVLDVPGTDAHMVHVRYTSDGATFDAHRYVVLNINSAARDTISADIMIGAYGTSSLLKVKNASGADVPFTITDSEGNSVESTEMVKGKWYTLSWTADGSATYKIHSFDGDNTGGKLAGNGTYYMKNIEVAPYVAAKYDVSFDLGYEGEAPATIQVVEGNAYGELPEVSREDYIFGGWYLDAECTVEVTAETVATKTEAHTLYAKWTLNAVNVSYDLGYAGGAVDAQQLIVGKAYGTLPTVADRLGYIFGGWYLDAECTAEVTADTIVTKTEDHTIYAKWTKKADTNEELTVVVGNATTTDVLFDTVGGKETAIYTTEGKQLDGNGYGRPVKMVLSDTSKEVIKFRFQFASCDATVEKLTFNYTVGVNTDANSGNYGNYVVLDENGKATYEFEVGKWYTFYGRTLGKENLYLWPVTNTTEKINVTMYFQDREVLDYEPDVNIRQEGTAYFGNAAPYQDAEGNWLVHYRSFTGSGAEGALQHNNTAWDRRTYIDIPAEYNYASFEFRFNVSQYAAAGAELADKIVAFEYLSATYVDMNGTPVQVADMVVGQWYKAIFANPIPTSTNYTIVMGTVQPGSGAIVNIDMDYRNAQGYTIGEVTNPFRTPASSSELSSTSLPAGSSGYYSSVTPIVLGDEVIYKHYIKSTGDGTNDGHRRTNLQITAAEKKIVSMKVYFESCSATPSIRIYRSDKGVAGFVVTDANGNIADHMNLQTKQWYTVTWIAESGISHYRVQPITGSAANGTYYMKDITVSDPVASNVLTGNYYTWIRPVVETNSYMVHARYTGDGTNISHREATLAISSASGELISMDINVAATSGTRLLKVLNASGTEMAITIADADGVAVDSSAMEFGKWYTLSWISDGSATYKIRSFDGSAANGTYYLKNIQSRQVENPFRVPTSGEMYVTNAVPAGTSGYYSSVTPVAFGDEVAYKHYIKATSDGINGRERRTHLMVTAAENQLVSVQVYFASCSATPSIQILTSSAGTMNFTVLDANGNVVDSNNLQVGQWYTVSWTAVSGQTNYRIYPITGSAANGTYYLKNIKVEDAVAVSFNLNYPEKSDNKGTVTQVQTAAYVEGKPYGALFTPDISTAPSYRRTTDGTVMNYSFGGWYTDAACTGEPVKATDIVVSGTTLYAKWINASYVVENNYPTTLAYNDGEWVYTNTVTVGKNLFQLRVPDTTYAVTYQIMLHDCDEGVNAVLTGYSAHRVWVDGERLTSGKTMTLEAGKWYTITFAHTTSSTTLVGAENAGYWGVMNVGTGSGTLKVSVKNVQTQSTPLT